MLARVCTLILLETLALLTYLFIVDGGENGHGAGVVRSLRQFDREEQKEFHVPIVMRDSGLPAMTGTCTLTVVIGDLNDNRHYGALKHITVYTLDGLSTLPCFILSFVYSVLSSSFLQQPILNKYTK